jgi:hypothetical protein
MGRKKIRFDHSNREHPRTTLVLPNALHYHLLQRAQKTGISKEKIIQIALAWWFNGGMNKEKSVSTKSVSTQESDVSFITAGTEFPQEPKARIVQEREKVHNA